MRMMKESSIKYSLITIRLIICKDHLFLRMRLAKSRNSFGLSFLNLTKQKTSMSFQSLER